MSTKEIRDVNKRFVVVYGCSVSCTLIVWSKYLTRIKKLNRFRFCRMYKNLPEVRKQRDEERRAEFYKTNRLRAQLYGKVGFNFP